MRSSARILLIEDDASAAAALERVLADEGYTVAVEGRGDKGLARAEAGAFDAVVTDLRLPGINGLELVERLHTSQPRTPIILITAHGTTETAIEAIKLGAFDYLLKPFEIEEFLQLLAKAIACGRMMTAPVDMGEPAAGNDAIVGNSRPMQDIYKQIGRIAGKPVTVLIRGETGTGKELIARALYQHSERSGGAFVAVNCAAIPETLLESELFGHERGAFTGADMRRIGRFEQADKGTIFLDEIGDMTLNTQSKLLRVLQERKIQRLGGKEDIAIDVRVIAATHRDLEEAIKEKNFREDLFYRLSMVVIPLPALRQRAEDIPLLVRYFMRHHGGELGVDAPSIQPEAIEFLKGQPWPGNVRQLENVVRQALLLARKYTISVDHVREIAEKSGKPAAAPETSLGAWIADLLMKARRGETEKVHAPILDSVERELFAQAIHLSQGNQAKAARWLGVSRITMREKLNTIGLHPSAAEGKAEE
jgi:nitrogen regulation protein NR(I)